MSSFGPEQSTVTSNGHHAEIPMSSWRVPKGWLESFFQQLSRQDLEHVERQRLARENLENHFASLLERQKVYQEQSEQLYKLREDLLERDLSKLHGTVDKYRERITDFSDQQAEAQTRHRELDNSIRSLQRELAGLRLEQAAQSDDDAVDQSGDNLPRLGRRFGIPQESDESSIANPALKPVDMGNIEVLAFQVSVLQNENARLKQDVQTMTEILEGSGGMPESKEPSDEKRLEWEIRAKAAEETARAMALLVEDLWHHGSPLVESQMVENPSFANRIRISPLKNIEQLVKIFETEQNKWFEAEKQYEQHLRNLEQGTQDLQDELEEAYGQNELQKSRATAIQGEKTKLEHDRLQLRATLDSLKVDVDQHQTEKDELQAELAGLRQKVVDLGEEVTQAARGRQAALARLGQNHSGVLWTGTEEIGDDFRNDFEIMRRSWSRDRQDRQEGLHKLLNPAKTAFDGEEVDVDGLIFAARSVQLALEQLEEKVDENTGYGEDLEEALAHLDGLLQRRNKDIDDEFEKTDACNQQLLDLDEALTKVAQEYAVAQASVHRVQKAYQQNQAAKEVAEQERQRFEESRESARLRLEGLGAERRKMSETLETQLRKQADLQEELAAERGKTPREATRIKELEDHSTHISGLMEQVRSALDAAQEAEETDHDALAGGDKKLENARSQVAEIEQLLWDSESALRDAKTESETTLKRLEQLRTRRDSCADELMKHREAVSQLFHEVKLHEFEKSQCRKSLYWLEQVLADARSQAHLLNQECSTIAELIEKQTDDDSALNRFIESFESLSERAGELRGETFDDSGTDKVLQRLDDIARSTAIDYSSKLRDRFLTQESELQESIETIQQHVLAMTIKVRELSASQSGEGEENPEDDAQREEERETLGTELEGLRAQWRDKELQLAKVRAEFNFHHRISQNISNPEESDASDSLSALMTDLAFQRSTLSILAAPSQHEGSPSQEIMAYLANLRDQMEAGQIDDCWPILDELESRFYHADQKRQAILASIEKNSKELEHERSKLQSVKTILTDPEREQQTFLDTTTYLLGEFSRQSESNESNRQLLAELEDAHRAVRDQNVELNEALNESRREIESLKAQLIKTREAQRNAEVNDDAKAIESQLEALQAKLNQEQKARRSLTQRLSAAKVESEKHLKEIGKLKELETKQQNSEKAQQEAQKFIEKHEQQLAQYKKEQDDESTTASDEEANRLMKKKEREIKKLKVFLESERKKNETLLEERKRLKKHIAEGKHTAGAIRERFKKRGTGKRTIALGNPTTLQPKKKGTTQKFKATKKIDPLKSKIEKAFGGAPQTGEKKHLIADLKETVRRAQTQATKMAQVYKRERQKHTESLKRLELLKKNQVHEGRLAELQVQMQRMQVRLKKESTARAMVERSSQSKLEALYRKLKDSEKKLATHNQKVSQLEAEINMREKSALTSKAETLRLGRELEEAMAKLSSKERALNEANQELSHREQRVTNLQDELQRAQRRVIDAEGESLTVQDLENRLDAARREALDAKKRLEENSGQLNQEQSHRDELERARQKAEAEIEQLNQRLSESSVLNMQSLEEAKRLERELEEAHNSLYQKEGDLEQARDSLNKKKTAVSLLESNLESARAELERNRAQARIEVRSIEDELAVARTEVEKRSETIEELSQKVKDDQQLQKNLEEMSASAEQLVSRLANIQNNYKTSELDVAEKTQQLSNAEVRLNDALQQIEELTVQVEDSTSTLSRLEESLETTKTTQSKLLSDKETLESRLESAGDSDTREIEDELVSHVREVRDVTEKIEELEQQYNEANTFAKHLRDRLNSAEKTAKQSREMIARTAGELTDQEHSKEALHEELENTRATLEKVSDERNHLAAQFIDNQDVENNHIEALQKELEVERDLRQSIEEQTKELGHAYKDELEKLREELAASQEALQTREEELVNTRERLKDTQEHAEELGTQVKEGMVALSQAEDAYERAYKEFAITQTPAFGTPLDPKFLEKQANTNLEFQKVRENLEELRGELEAKDGALQMAQDEAVVQKELANSLELALEEVRTLAAGEALQAQREKEANQAWLNELMESLEDTRSEFEDVRDQLVERENELVATQEELNQLAEDRSQALQMKEEEAGAREAVEEELSTVRQRCIALEARLKEQVGLLERGDQIKIDSVTGEASPPEDLEVQELENAQNMIQDITNEVKALRSALMDSESELGELRDKLENKNSVSRKVAAPQKDLEKVASLFPNERESELLHWIVNEQHNSENYSTPTKVLKDLVDSLYRHWDRVSIETELNASSKYHDTKNVWESMKMEAELNESEDLLGWITVDLPEALRKRKESQTSEAHLLVDEEAKQLEGELRRLEHTYQWAQSEGMATAELERKLESTRLRFEGMTGTRSIKLNANRIEEEYLHFYEELLKTKAENIKDLQDEKKKSERDAMLTISLMENENQNLVNELKNTYERLTDLDQVIMSLQAANPGQEIETLIHEQAELRQSLRRKSEEVNDLDGVIRASGEDTRIQLREARSTIDRLEEMLERCQDQNDSLQAALEEVTEE